MKSNEFAVMSRLEIDEELRSLISKMWMHGYRTEFSCSGQHSNQNFDVGYILFKKDTGDGWFEENSWRYGLTERKMDNCCFFAFENDKCCDICGAGVNGYSIYRGRLILDPELSGIDKTVLFDFIS